MAVIYKTLNFIVESAQKPHVDRDDGGHIRILPVVRVPARQHLAPILQIELARLTSVVGEAMMRAMNERGVDIGLINYQDMGNWGVFTPEGPYLHIHVYGRAKSAKTQVYGETVRTPLMTTYRDFYKDFKPLNEGDEQAIGSGIENLLTEERYSDKAWGLDALTISLFSSGSQEPPYS